MAMDRDRLLPLLSSYATGRSVRVSLLLNVNVIFRPGPITKKVRAGVDQMRATGEGYRRGLQARLVWTRRGLQARAGVDQARATGEGYRRGLVSTRRGLQAGKLRTDKKLLDFSMD